MSRVRVRKSDNLKSVGVHAGGPGDEDESWGGLHTLHTFFNCKNLFQLSRTRDPWFCSDEES